MGPGCVLSGRMWRMIGLVNLRWRKSSFSPSNHCVELAHVRGPEPTKLGSGVPLVLVRDSKNPEGDVLGFSERSFSSFLRNVPQM